MPDGPRAKDAPRELHMSQSITSSFQQGLRHAGARTLEGGSKESCSNTSTTGAHLEPCTCQRGACASWAKTSKDTGAPVTLRGCERETRRHTPFPPSPPHAHKACSAHTGCRLKRGGGVLNTQAWRISRPPCDQAEKRTSAFVARSLRNFCAHTRQATGGVANITNASDVGPPPRFA